MICIQPSSGDEPRFLKLVGHIASCSVVESRPADVYIVRIDHWFDHKWLAFAGKLYGAVAFHKPQRLTIPPFIPDRVVSQDAFRLDLGRTYYHKKRTQSLHRYQASGENLSRFIGNVSESGVFMWFSGDTALSDKGSIMV